MSVGFHEQFALDIDHFAHELKEQRPGWDLKLREAVKAVIRNVRDNKRLYERLPKRPGEYRRAPVRGFPYLLDYEVVGEDVILLSCHTAKDRPLRWEARVSSSEEE